MGRFCYTSHANFVFMWGVCLTHHVLPSCLSGSFSYTSHFALFFVVVVFIRGVSLTHTVLVSFLYRGSFPYTSCAGFIFILGVSLTHPVLVSHLSVEFLLHIPWLASFFKWGVSLTHPMLILFLCGEFLLHIPCCLHIYLGSLCYCYTSRAGFFSHF